MNEDAMSVAAVGRALIAVVCDGVSTAPGSGPAAQAAADAARAVLAQAVSSGQADLAEAMQDAVAIAQSAVVAAHAPDPKNPPSCTLAAAVVKDRVATIAWIGDSRVYWLGTDEVVCLTTDDSWAADQVSAGQLDQVSAEADHRAHEIERWLGADAADTSPHVLKRTLSGAGRVVACTDGLWNYASAPSDLSAQLDSIAPDAWPIDVARHLTSFALQAGGLDNVTVAVVVVTTADDMPEESDRPTTRTTRLRAHRPGGVSQ
jgi:serine/threonine protein phosphatase PrpC